MGARDEFLQDAGDLVGGVFRKYMRPPRSMRGSDWADEYRRIVKGPEPGPWRSSRTPYLREPLNCLDPESPVEKVVMQFATQLGKSEVLYNGVLKRIHLCPQDMMVVQPTIKDATDHSRERFGPTARAMAEVAAMLPDPKSRSETNTALTKDIGHGIATLYWAGANSARSLASKPLGFVCCDEIDGYPLDVDGEGDPLALVWERMSNFPNRKLLLCSTPTIRDFSRIEAEYLASDQRRYHVPCPHCGALQVLVWGDEVEYGIKWLSTPAGVPRAETAVYICQHCGAAIEEHRKAVMLAEGRWLAEQPGAQRGLVAGFHLSKLYSPLGWKSWPMLVEDWLKAQQAAKAGDVSRLKAFTNTSLAETWEEQGDRANLHELLRRAEDIPLRVVHWGHYVLTMGADVQGDRLEAYLWAWGRGMRAQLVDRAVFWGDPALPESEPHSPWAALTEYRRRPVLHASGREVPLFTCMVDSGGHHTQAVYAYARAHQGEHVHAVKGQSQAKKPIIAKPTDVDVSWRGQRVKRGAKLWPIGTDTAKGDIYGRLRLTQPGPGYVLLSKHLAPEVFDQLTAERLVTRYVKGRAKLAWVKPPGKANEGLDCAVYALAGAHWAGLDRWRDVDWDRWAHVEEVQAPPEQPQQQFAPQSAAPSLQTRISLAGMARFSSQPRPAR